MGVGDESGDRAEDGEGFNFEVRCRGHDHALVQGYVRVILFVDIQVLDKTLSEEVIE